MIRSKQGHFQVCFSMDIKRLLLLKWSSCIRFKNDQYASRSFVHRLQRRVQLQFPWQVQLWTKRLRPSEPQGSRGPSLYSLRRYGWEANKSVKIEIGKVYFEIASEYFTLIYLPSSTREGAWVVEGLDITRYREGRRVHFFICNRVDTYSRDMWWAMRQSPTLVSLDNSCQPVINRRNIDARTCNRSKPLGQSSFAYARSCTFLLKPWTVSNTTAPPGFPLFHYIKGNLSVINDVSTSEIRNKISVYCLLQMSAEETAVSAWIVFDSKDMINVS